MKKVLIFLFFVLFFFNYANAENVYCIGANADIYGPLKSCDWSIKSVPKEYVSNNKISYNFPIIFNIFKEGGKGHTQDDGNDFTKSYFQVCAFYCDKDNDNEDFNSNNYSKDFICDLIKNKNYNKKQQSTVNKINDNICSATTFVKKINKKNKIENTAQIKRTVKLNESNIDSKKITTKKQIKRTNSLRIFNGNNSINRTNSLRVFNGNNSIKRTNSSIVINSNRQLGNVSNDRLRRLGNVSNDRLRRLGNGPYVENSKVLQKKIAECAKRETIESKNKCNKAVSNLRVALQIQATQNDQGDPVMSEEEKALIEYSQQRGFNNNIYNPKLEKLLNSRGWTQINPGLERQLNAIGRTQVPPKYQKRFAIRAGNTWHRF